MPRRNLVCFCAWAGAAVLLAGLVPVSAVLGLSPGYRPEVHVVVACLLPVPVGMTVRSAAVAMTTARTS